jgi:hypothetical protein
MATTNVTLTEDWQEIVAAGDEFFLSIPYIYDAPQVDVATAAAEPAVDGHRLDSDRGQEMNRTLIGPGKVWARSRNDEVTVVLTAWTP